MNYREIAAQIVASAGKPSDEVAAIEAALIAAEDHGRQQVARACAVADDVVLRKFGRALISKTWEDLINDALAAIAAEEFAKAKLG